MKVIGIVGGIGTGKSTVVQLLRELTNAYVINADHIGHLILKKGEAGYTPVLEAFGDGITGEDGEINRQELGKIVFSDPNKLKELNKISHPLIYNKAKEEINYASKKEKYDYIIIDAALLIEIGLIELVDEVWGVYTSPCTQIKRIMLRNGVSEEEAKKRISSQLPWSEIKKVTHVEINNDTTIKSTKEQIEKLIKQKLKGL